MVTVFLSLGIACETGTYLCANAEGMARGKRVTVIPRSLMDKFTMKYSAGFRDDLFRYATRSRTPFPRRDSTPDIESTEDKKYRKCCFFSYCGFRLYCASIHALIRAKHAAQMLMLH